MVQRTIWAGLGLAGMVAVTLAFTAPMFAPTADATSMRTQSAPMTVPDPVTARSRLK